MKTRSFDFYFHDLDTTVVVEDAEDAVLVRASRDAFTPRRKLNFIRELAAEGFIADCFRRVRWLVDASLATPGWMSPRVRIALWFVCGWERW
jgi:hypothetical protein